MARVELYGSMTEPVAPMKTETLARVGAAIAALFAGGCSSAPPTNQSPYPVTYNIQVDNTQSPSDYNAQATSASATRDVAVASGQTLYYKVESPVDVTVYFYGVESPGESGRIFLAQMQGRTFVSSIMPNKGTLEFVFIATQPNSHGTVKFTLSDHPLAPLAAQ
jgi:hypothetical protein